MGRALTGIVAFAGVACAAAAWRPGLAGDESRSQHFLLARAAAAAEVALPPDEPSTQALSAAEAALWGRLREHGPAGGT